MLAELEPFMYNLNQEGRHISKIMWRPLGTLPNSSISHLAVLPKLFIREIFQFLGLYYSSL